MMDASLSEWCDLTPISLLNETNLTGRSLFWLRPALPRQISRPQGFRPSRVLIRIKSLLMMDASLSEWGDFTPINLLNQTNLTIRFPFFLCNNLPLKISRPQGFPPP